MKLQPASFTSCILPDPTTSKVMTLFVSFTHTNMSGWCINVAWIQETEGSRFFLPPCGFKLVSSGMVAGSWIWQAVPLMFIFNTKCKFLRMELDSMCSSGRPQMCDPSIPILDSIDLLQYIALI